MPNEIQQRVSAALAALQPDRIHDLAVDDAGQVSFTFHLKREDPATLVRDARRAVQALEGVTGVKINVVDSATPAGPASRSGAGPGRASSPVPPPPSPEDMPRLGRALAISSGKGGVGKSTVSANLAVALAREGHAVGLMDADIYGPNIPRMMGVDEKPPVLGGKIQPLEAHGVKLMSLGFIVERDQPAIWRGPIIMKIIQQFLHDVDWGELDYFLVDLPPGTGDAQLSLVQTIHLHGALIVTTPQEVATGDSLRGAKMFERVGTKVLGVVENMSYYVCEHCGERSELFQSGGGERLAAELGVPLLGQIPLQAGLARLADSGQPIVASQPDSPAAKALADTARQVAALLQSARSGPLPVTR
ncbi:MAG TPA: Mrp/NBP35 family ATP-binding protein [Gemmatimonadales bacterium]|nr:Mrp/NBP35 family ATP-binding protein [Gemmatimonadales bacterium]